VGQDDGLAARVTVHGEEGIDGGGHLYPVVLKEREDRQFLGAAVLGLVDDDLAAHGSGRAWSPVVARRART
jgi:hypothetical protein